MQARLARPSSPSPGGEGRGEGGQSPPLEKNLHRQIMDYCDAQWPRWKYIHSRMDKSTATNPACRISPSSCPKIKKTRHRSQTARRETFPRTTDWHAEMDRLDHTVHLVYSFDDFLSILRDIGQHLVQSNTLMKCTCEECRGEGKFPARNVTARETYDGPIEKIQLHQHHAQTIKNCARFKRRWPRHPARLPQLKKLNPARADSYQAQLDGTLVVINGTGRKRPLKKMLL